MRHMASGKTPDAQQIAQMTGAARPRRIRR